MESAYIFENIPFPAADEDPRTSENNVRNGEGDVIELSDGRLLMVYGEFLGGSDHAPATLQGVVSSDHGRTWEGKHTVQENIGGKNVMCVSLLRLAGSDMLMGFLRKDREHSHCTPFMRRSSDEGTTWSEPEPVVEVSERYHVVNNVRLVQMKGGRLLMPASVSENRTKLGDIVFYSDDDGRTWSGSNVHPFLPESKSGAQEPGVIELNGGRVMMWCRCDLGEIYRCYSEDACETFGPWEPMGLKAPVSPAAIKRLPSTADLVCIFNNHETPPEYWAVGRSPLTAAVSSDEGATWRIAGDLEPDRTNSYCYTSVTFIPDNEVLLTYYLGRNVETVEDGEFHRRHYNLSHLKVAIFKETWLYGRDA